MAGDLRFASRRVDLSSQLLTLTSRTSTEVVDDDICCNINRDRLLKLSVAASHDLAVLSLKFASRHPYHRVPYPTLESPSLTFNWY